jgi:hypothetical protein
VKNKRQNIIANYVVEPNRIKYVDAGMAVTVAGKLYAVLKYFINITMRVESFLVASSIFITPVFRSPALRTSLRMLEDFLTNHNSEYFRRVFRKCPDWRRDRYNRFTGQIIYDATRIKEGDRLKRLLHRGKGCSRPLTRRGRGARI